MSVVQQVLIDRLINYLDDVIHRGKVKLNGQYVNYDIFKTVKEGNVLRKYIYLETETGYVEEAQLLTSTNEVLAIKPFSIEKEDNGLVLAFEFKITIQEQEE
ncbi:hypothetical protein [Sporosarcina psychrophila]|uniref:Uncharacterized protein n=1 Tax=Sporosarcina psychrophila TaxID=1476 RepID=A0ABV2K9R9_SPOPS